MSILLNLSATTNFKTPKIVLAVSLIDLNGDIKIIPPGFLFAAKYTAGPDPIDRPHATMSLGLTFN
jgi:hypothetical protein